MENKLAGAAITIPNSNISAGSLTNVKFLSQWSSLIDTNTQKQVYQQSNGGVMWVDILRASGAETSIPSQDMTCVEEAVQERAFKVKTTVAAAGAGATLTIDIHADSFEYSSTKNPVRQYDVIMIPGSKMSDGKPATYWVSAVATAVLPNDRLTCLPTDDAFDVDVAIAAGEYIPILYNAFARGTAGPVGRIDYPDTKTYTTGLIKEAMAIEGGVQATKMLDGLIPYNGSMWLINEDTRKMERRMEQMKDFQCLLGQKKSNASLVQTTSLESDSGLVRITDGVITNIRNNGLSGTFADTFDIDDFHSITDALISQRLYTTNVGFYVGHELYSQIQDVLRDYTREFSGGSDLYNKLNGVLGITPKGFELDGVTFWIQPLASFSDPAILGLAPSGTYEFEFPYSGIIVPDSTITVQKWGEKVNASIPNVGLGYVNYNGENRGLLTKRILGMNGLVDGMDVADDVDRIKLAMLSEFMIYGGLWNQKMYVTKQQV
jgi:hypothetical protein